MNNEKLAEVLNKIPVAALLIAYCGYLAIDYYNFTEDAQSPMKQKEAVITTTKNQNTETQKKIKEAHEFYKNLEAKRVAIRDGALKLQEMKVTLSEELDIPNFLKLLITEAKKTGLNVQSLKPTDSKREEFYTEQNFEMLFRGAYIQVIMFLDRISNSQKIIRVENFEIKPFGSNISRVVELEGRIQLKTYKYESSKADELANASDSKKAPVEKKAGGGA